MLGKHCTTTAIHVLDPVEITASFSGPVQLHWGSKKRNITSAHAQASAQLSRELQARTETIAASLRRAKISYFQLSVAQDDLSAVWSERQP